MVYKVAPATFNQAIMDFGALQCIPKNPDCSECVLNHKCRAYKNNLVSEIPSKKRKKGIRKRYFHYLVVEYDQKVHIEKRSKGDIWTGLFQFKLIEKPSAEVIKPETIKEYLNIDPESVEVSKEYRQKLTHQDLSIIFYQIRIKENSLIISPFNLVDKGNLKNFAYPKIIDIYLRENSIYL